MRRTGASTGPVSPSTSSSAPMSASSRCSAMCARNSSSAMWPSGEASVSDDQRQAAAEARLPPAGTARGVARERPRAPRVEHAADGRRATAGAGRGRGRRRARAPAVNPRAISATPASAATTPARLRGLRRSPEHARASSTVVTGYSAPSTETTREQPLRRRAARRGRGGEVEHADGEQLRARRAARAAARRAARSDDHRERGTAASAADAAASTARRRRRPRRQPTK